MNRKTLQKKHFADWVLHLQKQWTVCGPKAREQQFSFEKIEEPGEIRLDYDNSILPPVRQLYPNQETLLKFRLDQAGEASISLSEEKVALLGVHPCDLHAIQIVDEIMMEDPADLNYVARRKNCLIVGLPCQKPCDEQTLCHDKGTGTSRSGFDLMLTDLGDRYLVEIASLRGEEALEGFDAAESPAHHDHREAQVLQEEWERNFEKKLRMPADYLNQYLKESYDDMIWDALGQKCLSCGSCNIVCPTCYCFDTKDEVSLDLCNGERCRSWDSCQLNNFAVVAGGENFREKPGARLRHRVFRKEVYLHDRYLRSACVGCGRCNRACVAGINLIDIYNQVMGV